MEDTTNDCATSESRTSAIGTFTGANTASAPVSENEPANTDNWLSTCCSS